MARLRDVHPVLRSFGTWEFSKRVMQQVSEDNILVWGSALAYSWLFAIFPFLIVLMSVIAHLPHDTRKAVHDSIRQFAAHALPDTAQPLIIGNIDAIMHETRHGQLLSIGLIITLWSASGGMAMTMYALDQCYDIRHRRSFFKQRPLAIGLTVVVAAMVLAVFTLVPLGTAITNWLVERGDLTPTVAMILTVLRYALSCLMMFGVLAVMYYFGPTIRQRFHLFSPGAVFSVAVWILLAETFRFYVNHFGKYDQTYGTVGGVAILLLFFYIDAVVLLIGAEINSEIDFEVLGVPPGSLDFTGQQKPGLTDPASTEAPKVENEMSAD